MDSYEQVTARVNEVVSELRKAGLSAYVDRIRPLIKPCIGLSIARVEESSLELGTSKIGGSPDLPTGTEWPPSGSVPLSFIAQFRLSDVAPYDWEKSLPSQGNLYFFYDLNVWGFDPNDRSGWRVLYNLNEAVTLHRTTSPQIKSSSFWRPLRKKGHAFPACKIEFSPDVTLPDLGTHYWRLGMSDKDFDRYVSVMPSGHQLLGNPVIVQNEMELECQLAFHGLYCGNATGYQDPRARGLEAGAKEWRLLLQIKSDEESEMMWGDLGIIYYWIRSRDLATQNFENTWFILQCT